jgi:serpin B
MGRLLVAVVLIAGACVPAPSSSSPSPESSAITSSSPTSNVATIRATGSVVRSEAVRAAADPDAAKRAAKATAALGTDLYAQFARDQQNMVFSPYSVALALAMTRAGAAGKTAAEMDTVLHASLVGDTDAGFNGLDRSLAKRSGTYPGGIGAQPATLELASADRLWGQRGFDFGVPYLDRIATSYGAGVGIVDYVNAREDARKMINAWVSDQTRARITELIPDGVLNELTRFVLVNAIYMKAQWSKPFGTARPGPFHRLDGSTVQAPLMRAGTYQQYGRGPGYQAVGISYVGGVSMVVIVPDAGAFGSFENGLDGQRLGAVIDGLAPTYVDLQLPKFQFRTAASLKGPLSRLGMPTAFTDKADFLVISPREPLLLQEALHQAFIAVDEKGTEAAAATGFFGGATGGPSQVVDLTVDRPFLFVVRDDETGAILFMGRVLDPNL